MTINRALLLRVAKRTSFILLGLFIIALFISGWMITTQSGLQWLTKRLLPSVPELTINSVEGRLIGPIKIQGIHYHNKQIDLKIDKTFANWQPKKLFTGIFRIDTFTLSGVNFRELAASPSTTQPAITQQEKSSLSLEEQFDQLSLPVDIDINSMEIADGRYEPYGSVQPITLERFRLSATTHKQQLSIKEISLASSVADIQGQFDTHLSKSGLYDEKKTNGKLNWALKSQNINPQNSTPQTIKTIKGDSQFFGNKKNRTLNIHTHLAGPYSSSIEIAISQLLTDPNLLAKIQLEDINLAEINTEWPGYNIRGSINANGNTDIADINSLLTIKEPDQVYEMTINSSGNWKGKKLDANILATVPNILEEAQLTGSLQPDLLNIQDSDALELALNWKNINIPTRETVPAKKTSTTPLNTLSSQKGNILFSGNLKNFSFNLDALFSAYIKDKQEGELLISGTGSTEKLIFNKIIVTGPVGELNGQGDINLTPSLAANINLSGKDINPGILSTDWPGNLELDLLINTSNSSPETSTTYVDMSASGTLRNHPISLTTKANYTQTNIATNNVKSGLYDDSIAIEEMTLNSGGSKISITGALKPDKDIIIDWSIFSENLEELAPKAKGKLRTQGNAQANIQVSNQGVFQSLLDTTKINADLTASSLNIAEAKIGTILASISTTGKNNNGKNSGDINLQAKKIALGDLNIHSAIVDLNGKLDGHQFTIDTKSDKGDIDLTVDGKLQNLASSELNKPQWLFNLLTANIRLPNLAPWQLNQPAKGVVSTGQKSINRNCWVTTLSEKDNVNDKNINYKKPSRICFDVENLNDSVQANFSIADLQTEYFSSFFPEDLSWTDTLINGEGKVKFFSPNQGTSKKTSSKHLDADIKLTTTAGKLIWQAATIKEDQNKTGSSKLEESSTQSIAIEQGMLSLQSTKESIQASLALPIEQQPGINGSLSIINSDVSFTQRKLTGKLQLALNDLSPFVSLVPDASNLEGKLESEWIVGGSIAQPWLDGNLALTDGQVQLNGPGISLEELTLMLSGDQRSGIQYQASASSGGGILRAEGEIKLPQTQQGLSNANSDVEKTDYMPEFNLHLTGENAQVFGTEEATVFISPDIKVLTKNNNLAITGSVTVPKASITPKRIPESVVSVSEDQVIIDSQKEPTLNTPRQNISANIDILLGDEVSIDGFGFKGLTTGKLNVIKEKQGPTLGQGEIKIIDGEYRAFGQGLVIDKGLILFTGGPVNKPGIDIKALRRPAEDITVGVFARGSLDQPDLTIFSEPSMTQSEQLSWLVLGRPIEQSSEGENNAISQLLLSLSLSKGDSFVSSLGDTFSLDTVRIKTGSGEAGAASDNDLAELVLGKYLSPELYVSYGIGLFKPVNVLSLEYSLGRHWKLTSETSSESSGGDIVYTIER